MFSRTISVSDSRTAFLHHVSAVIRIRTEEQMLRVDTPAIVARVKNPFASGNDALVDLVHQPMS
jgi:hypothetical protein